jgi:hypothetical protein
MKGKKRNIGGGWDAVVMFYLGLKCDCLLCEREGPSPSSSMISGLDR